MVTIICMACTVHTLKAYHDMTLYCAYIQHVHALNFTIQVQVDTSIQYYGNKKKLYAQKLLITLQKKKKIAVHTKAVKITQFLQNKTKINSYKPNTLKHTSTNYTASSISSMSCVDRLTMNWLIFLLVQALQMVIA